MLQKKRLPRRAGTNPPEKGLSMFTHHETISAKLASAGGAAGHFAVVEEDNVFSISEDSHLHGTGYDSLAAAVENAQTLADQFDKDKLDDLKAQWKKDPCWDIEDSNGFEAFRQELYIFRLETELAHAHARQAETDRALSSLAQLLKPFLPAHGAGTVTP